MRICDHAGMKKCLGASCINRLPHECDALCDHPGECVDGAETVYAHVECVPVDSPAGRRAIRRTKREEE